jgi:catechol 2,3-dioxygenase-like lactoylglutathione lyase family enzyme
VKIEELYHVIHLAPDRAPLDAWYDEVFQPRRGFMDANYYDGEQRDASLVTIADAVVEVLAPARFADGWEAMPIGRFFTRFGRHWHSIAWYVADVGEAWDHLRSHGLRVIFPGGAPGDDTRPGGATPIFTHPRETLTQLQFTWRRPAHGAEEFAARRDIDPRYLPGWSSDWWADNHPLGIKRLAYLTIVTADPAQARAVYADILGGEVLGAGTSALTATDDLYVQVGPQTIIQISRPDDQPSLARADLDQNGSMLHAVAFEVRDLDEAENHLRAHGIGVVGRDEHTLLVDPADTFGAVYRFTTETIAEQGAAPGS